MRVVAWLAFGSTALLVSACSVLPGPDQSSPSPVPTGPALDTQVPLPVGFPPDVPIYAGARLTAASAFTSSGQATWGMEWETRDPVSKVLAFYSARLNEGDWTARFTSSTAAAFAATFSRKSNSRAAGTVAGKSEAGITKILLSLVAPAA